jgi:hypothetical protein
MGPLGCSESQILVGLRWLAKITVISGHGHEIARGHIGGRVRAAKMNADPACNLTVEATREADRAEGMEGFVMDRLSPRQPSRNVSTGVTAGWR